VSDKGKCNIITSTKSAEKYVNITQLQAFAVIH